MWKRLKTPWTVVLVLVLAFAGMLGRIYYRSRTRAALVAELEEDRYVSVSWQYVGPIWLHRFMPANARPFRRHVVSGLKLGDDELLARVVDYLPRVILTRAGDNSVVTDDTLRRVGQLKRLGALYLPQTQVTNAGLQHLTGRTELASLDLSQTQVTDAGLQHLAALTQLNDLYLSQTQVTDAGLQHLAGLTGLGALDLSQTQVTDAGLRPLAGLLARFGRLDLSQTQVTKKGVAALQKTNPGLQIKMRRVPEAREDEE